MRSRTFGAPGTRSGPGVLLAAGIALGAVLATAGSATAATPGPRSAHAASPHATTPTTATLTLDGDPGDGGGAGTYAYGSADGDTFGGSADSTGEGAHVSVNGRDGSNWSLDLDAGRGATLRPGTYTGAGGYDDPANTGPGIAVRRWGGGCTVVSGSFTVTSVTYGPYGYLQELDATFTQQCAGAAAAIGGEVRFTAPRPDPALTVGLTVDPVGKANTLNGRAVVGGTVTCSEPAVVQVTGTVTEVAHRVLITGAFGAAVACVPGAPVPWSAQSTVGGTTPFQKGAVEVDADASAADPHYGDHYAEADHLTVEVKLAKYRP